jgi:hypothetical protein
MMNENENVNNYEPLNFNIKTNLYNFQYTYEGSTRKCVAIEDVLPLWTITIAAVLLGLN